MKQTILSAKNAAPAILGSKCKINQVEIVAPLTFIAGVLSSFTALVSSRFYIVALARFLAVDFNLKIVALIWIVALVRSSP
ncbi:MAG: hypothetical protein A6F71_09825 [Cycloclasticus sp. symbiont of Poecilosclerida sp. M]|nr:MAG: hypothetical protein A6F71_09825 [Cycloclasticus sp. symbiont of Poecilosclerida sp. M]